MPQREVELILTRQLASYLTMPIFLTDAEGILLYYNEPAERLLGRRYEEVGEMPIEEWSAAFRPTGEDGERLREEDLPLVTALKKHRPAHRVFSITGLDGRARRIAATAFPIEGQHGRQLGAVSIFWEAEGE